MIFIIQQGDDDKLGGETDSTSLPDDKDAVRRGAINSLKALILIMIFEESADYFCYDETA